MTLYRVVCSARGCSPGTFDNWDDAHAVAMSHRQSKPGHKVQLTNLGEDPELSGVARTMGARDHVAFAADTDTGVQITFERDAPATAMAGILSALPIMMHPVGGEIDGQGRLRLNCLQYKDMTLQDDW